MTQSCSKSTIVPGYNAVPRVTIQMQNFRDGEIQIQWRTNTNTLAQKYQRSVAASSAIRHCRCPRPPTSLPAASLHCLRWPGTITIPWGAMDNIAWYHYNTMGVPFQCFTKYFQNPITICYFARTSVLTSLLIPSQQISNSTITRPKAIQPNPLLSILL